MSNQSKYRNFKRTIYMKPDVWARAKKAAIKAGMSTSEYITQALIDRITWRGLSMVACPHCDNKNQITINKKCFMCGKNLTKKGGAS